jgi:hypothetical protein
MDPGPSGRRLRTIEKIANRVVRLDIFPALGKPLVNLGKRMDGTISRIMGVIEVNGTSDDGIQNHRTWVDNPQGNITSRP